VEPAQTLEEEVAAVEVAVEVAEQEAVGHKHKTALA
jgi:hypothetical protein